MKRSHNVIAIPPGETIKEQLKERSMKQKEFAMRMGMSEKHISKLINGEVQLTVDMARKLEMVLGVPTQFWCNLESLYREDMIKVKEENAMEEDAEIAQYMPYKEMVRNGWVIDVTKKTDQIVHLRKYFELAQLKYLQSTLVPRIACKKVEGNKKDECALIAWAQKAKLEARKIETKQFNMDKVKSKISIIQKMQNLELNDFRAELIKVLSECGVAVVFLPTICEGSIKGATFLDGNKVVMGLKLCDDRDEFFDCLFHELAHIIYGHIEKEDGISEEDEIMADKFVKQIKLTKKHLPNIQ
jgi:HTH-type transcriptional regulator/antitoxin HigA